MNDQEISSARPEVSATTSAPSMLPVPDKAGAGYLLMESGWVKIYRKVMDNPIWLCEPFTRGQAWIDLILIANHKPGYFRSRGVRIDVDRGQTGNSLETLAKRWKWSKGKVRRFICELETEGQIVTQKTNVTTLITICNYESYQESDTQKEPQTARRRPADGPQTARRQYTNKNEKNEKNEKNVKNKECTPRDCAHSPEDESNFSKFQAWITENAPAVSKMDQPFTIEEFLKVKAAIPVAKIQKVLTAMDNYKPLLKKNKSAYKTLLKWHEMDRQRGNNSPVPEKVVTHGASYAANLVKQHEQKWAELTR